MLYQIQAQAVVTRDGAETVVQLPTFLLDSDIQGIVSADHAKRVANSMIVSLVGPAEVFVSAVERDPEVKCTCEGGCRCGVKHADAPCPECDCPLHGDEILDLIVTE